MEVNELNSPFPAPLFKIHQPVRLIELFGGVGSQAMALRDIGADFEHYRLVEFDKAAVNSYNAIHGTDFPVMDITQTKGVDLGITDTNKFCYIMTYSFPCQDLSLSGKQKGMSKGSGTRSGLLWEVERLLNEVSELPQVLLMENVPQVHSKTKKKKLNEYGNPIYDEEGNFVYEKSNYENFMDWISFLESKGYSNFYQDLNAKDYGVAQCRNRCFMVSILGDYSYQFPEKIPLHKVLKDYLEPEVDEKYYIKNNKAKLLINSLIERNLIPFPTSPDKISRLGNISNPGSQCGTVVSEEGLSPNLVAGTHGYANHHIATATIVAMRGRYQSESNIAGTPTEQRLEPNTEGICNTLTTVQKDNMVLESMPVGIKQIGNLWGENTEYKNKSTGRVYSQDGLAPTLNTMQGGWKQPMIIEEIPVDLSVKNPKPLTIGNCIQARYDKGISNQQSTGIGVLHIQSIDEIPEQWQDYVYEIQDIFYLIRVRKLTPLECWRLMNFTDEDFFRAASNNSNTALYKQAGNSIVKAVLMAIFEKLFL